MSHVRLATMSLPDETYIDVVVRELQRLKELADRAMDQLSDEQFFAAPADADNSVAIMVKHVAGNMRSRWTDFLTADGEKPDRNRDTEFMLTEDDTRQHVLDRWEASWRILFSALRPLSADDLNRTVTVRGEPLTALQAINRQLTHYAYHVGQIVYLAKHHAGEEWKSLSIPRGESEQFNRGPERYLK